MKRKLALISAIILVCAFVFAGCPAQRNEYAPYIKVKQPLPNDLKPGDSIDLNDLVEVDVEGEYKLEYDIQSYQSNYDIDDNGVLSVLDNGNAAMNTLLIEYTATGETNISTTTAVSVDVRTPINEKNSYEANVSGVSFRMYNDLTDDGSGVFKYGEGFADNHYQIIVRPIGSADSLGSAEAEIKEYAREKYFMDETTSEYKSESAALASGEEAKKITFLTSRSEGKYSDYASSGGTVVRVHIYVFEKDGKFYCLENNDSWTPKCEYEAEQILGTIK